MKFSNILRAGVACAALIALAACQSSGGGSKPSGGGGTNAGGSTGGSTGGGSGSTGGEDTGSGGGEATSGTAQGLGAFRVARMGETTDVDQSPLEGSPVTVGFTQRSGNTPGKVSFKSSVSAGGQALGGDDVEFTGMMVRPTDQTADPTFSEDFYGANKTTAESTGERVKVFYRLGNIQPQHVALINYEGPGSRIGDRVSGYAVAGNETPTDSLPKGSVIYDGRFTGDVGTSSNGYSNGNATATVNFVDKSINGRIWNPEAANQERSPVIRFNGELEGSRFHAKSLTATKDNKTTELITPAGGTLVGGIFGPKGEELGAAVSTPMVMSSDRSDFFWVRGGVVAKKK